MENKSSSNLIKSIYKSYVDLKTGDLHDLDYDILLENIKSLYTEVKSMRVHPFDKIDDSNSESIDQKNSTINPIDSLQKEEIKITNVTNPEPINESVNTNETQVLDTSNQVQNVPMNPQVEEKSVQNTAPEIQNQTTLNEPIETQETEEVAEVEDFQEDMSQTDAPESQKEDELTSPNLIEKNITENLNDKPISEKESIQDIQKNDTSDDLLEFELNEKSIKEKSSNNIVSFLKEDNVNTNYKPVGDLIDMIDINSRIGLVEIFFKGDSLSLSESLSVLNKMDDRNKCIQLIDKLAEKYNVSQEDDIYGTFINLIDRKFGIN